MIYGRKPSQLLDYTAGRSNVDALDVALEQRDGFFNVAKEWFLEAQQRMKSMYDTNHRVVEFADVYCI